MRRLGNNLLQFQFLLLFGFDRRSFTPRLARRSFWNASLNPIQTRSITGCTGRSLFKVSSGYYRSISIPAFISIQFLGGTYESLTLESVFKVMMKLVIRPVESTDFGAYKCVAKNSIGESEKTVTIHRK